LREYWLILKRRWITILVAAVAGVATGVAGSLVITPEYEASATVVFSGHASTNGQDLAYVGTYVQGRMQTYRRVGLSSIALRHVMSAVGSKKRVEDFRDTVDIEVSPVNTTATATATSRNPRTAAATANALATTLIGEVGAIEHNADAQASVTGDLISKADVPRHPFRPNITVYVVLGLVFGLVIGTAVAVVREVLAGDAPVGEGT
jgi:capsular polysaccharide biosynthesis protein